MAVLIRQQSINPTKFTDIMEKYFDRFLGSMHHKKYIWGEGSTTRIHTDYQVDYLVFSKLKDLSAAYGLKNTLKYPGLILVP